MRRMLGLIIAGTFLICEAQATPWCPEATVPGTAIQSFGCQGRCRAIADRVKDELTFGRAL
jgi:hypothetical protein